MNGNKNFSPVSLPVNLPLVAVLPAGTAVFIISIGKGSYVFFTVSQGRAVPVWRKNLPCLARYFLPKTLQTLNTTLLSLCETKTTDPTGRRIKKSRIYGKQKKSSVKLQLPHLSNPHKIKNLKITAIWKQRYYRKQKFM